MSLKFSSNWKKHYLTHSSKEDKPHKCQLCDKAFITLTSYRNHMAKKHDREESMPTMVNSEMRNMSAPSFTRDMPATTDMRSMPRPENRNSPVHNMRDMPAPNSRNNSTSEIRSLHTDMRDYPPSQAYHGGGAYNIKRDHDF